MRDEVVAAAHAGDEPRRPGHRRRLVRKNLGTPFETSPVPQLYHHYIGHDNNRDWYMFTQVETQAVARMLYHQWFPQIVYNHHQIEPVPGPHLGSAVRRSGESEPGSARS